MTTGSRVRSRFQVRLKIDFDDHQNWGWLRITTRTKSRTRLQTGSKIAHDYKNDQNSSKLQTESKPGFDETGFRDKLRWRGRLIIAYDDLQELEWLTVASRTKYSSRLQYTKDRRQLAMTSRTEDCLWWQVEKLSWQTGLEEDFHDKQDC